MADMESTQLRKVSAGWVGYAQLMALLGLIGAVVVGYYGSQVEGYYGTETNGGVFVLLSAAFAVTVFFYLAPIFLLARVVLGLAAVLERLGASASSDEPPPAPQS